jgi:hypothetical protein
MRSSRTSIDDKPSATPHAKLGLGIEGGESARRHRLLVLLRRLEEGEVQV